MELQQRPFEKVLCWVPCQLEGGLGLQGLGSGLAGRGSGFRV